MYVQLDADYYDHPKTMQLIATVGPEADCYPPRLWTWCLKFAKQGILRHPTMLEIACRWKGEKGSLHKAMVECGFLEPDGVTLHGWMERTGKDILRYEQKKESMREYFQKVGSKNRDAIRIVSDKHPEAIHINGTELNGTKLNGADRSTPAGLLASHYCSQNKGVISFDKAKQLCQFFLDGGGSFKAAEAEILNKGKGRKVWEILDPIRPAQSTGMGSILDIANSWMVKK